VIKHPVSFISIHFSIVQMNEESVRKRYYELYSGFRFVNTLELSSGRCACVKCKKLFRNGEFLRNHFERVHAMELTELEQKARNDIEKGSSKNF